MSFLPRRFLVGHLRYPEADNDTPAGTAEVSNISRLRPNPESRLRTILAKGASNDNGWRNAERHRASSLFTRTHEIYFWEDVTMDGKRQPLDKILLIPDAARNSISLMLHDGNAERVRTVEMAKDGLESLLHTYRSSYEEVHQQAASLVRNALQKAFAQAGVTLGDREGAALVLSLADAMEEEKKQAQNAR